MKNTAFFIALSTLSFSAFAGLTADLNLKGNVPVILDISVAHEAAASQLDLVTVGNTNNLKVATVTEKSNIAGGYKVKAKSLKGSKLVHLTDSNSSVPYTLTYGGNSISLGSSFGEIYSTSNQKGTFNKDVKISYNIPANSNLSAGDHVDTVTFQIEAN